MHNVKISRSSHRIHTWEVTINFVFISAYSLNFPGSIKFSVLVFNLCRELKLTKKLRSRFVNRERIKLTETKFQHSRTMVSLRRFVYTILFLNLINIQRNAAVTIEFSLKFFKYPDKSRMKRSGGKLLCSSYLISDMEHPGNQPERKDSKIL